MATLPLAATVRCVLCNVRTPVAELTVLSRVPQSVCSVCAALTPGERDTLRTQAMTRMLLNGIH
jgi:hypothetical protein